ncbi:MAG TPA: glycosyltransferase family 39 protein [Patescibacteria group bacterium]|nr:glycosyltransferase family 39 protein [Patescibacteria group bacterium]
MKYRLFVILFFIVFIGFVFRFYQLGTNPPSLTWDEVSWGYNAYSLGIDGRDEFGRLLPYDYLESFGDFKPPLYAYLDIFPVKLFGLTEFAVRFPSALFGTLTVLLTYFLVKQIFVSSKYREQYALVAAGLLAISPWHIMLSRAAFEANVASFLLVAGVWLFLFALQQRPWLMVVSALSFVLCFYTFNSVRIVAPLLVIVLSIGFWKQLWLIKKQVIVAAVVGIIALAPLIPFLFSPQASLRYKEVNIFSDIEVIKNVNQQIANDENTWWSKILHNRRFAYAVEYGKHYLDNLSPSFLFITGDGNPKFSTQSLGQLYFFELPFLLLGILLIFKKREDRWWLIPLWLLLAIIPAATARETPHALRIEGTLPMFQIFVAYGLVQAFFFMKRHQSKIIKQGLPLIITGFFFFAAYNVAYFIEDYYRHYPKAYSAEWQYGYKDALLYSQKVETQYDKIYFTKELGRPYIYELFYHQYDPKAFRKEAIVHRDPFGFVTIERVGKYYFEKDSLDKTENSRILYIDIPAHVPENAIVKKTFYLVNGEKALVAYTR